MPKKKYISARMYAPHVPNYFSAAATTHQRTKIRSCTSLPQDTESDMRPESWTRWNWRLLYATVRSGHGMWDVLDKQWSVDKHCQPIYVHWFRYRTRLLMWQNRDGDMATVKNGSLHQDVSIKLWPPSTNTSPLPNMCVWGLGILPTGHEQLWKLITNTNHEFLGYPVFKKTILAVSTHQTMYDSEGEDSETSNQLPAFLVV